MGNSNKGEFSSRNWAFDRRNHNIDIYHDGRGTYAEKHVIPNNPKVDPSDEIEVYNFRNATNKPIVRVYEADYAKSESMCGADRNIEVFSEYIPHRLSDTRNLNHGQALYVLSESLAGFHELHHRFGPFQITDDHIGFNEQGDTRVWHSPNFATNHLPHDSIVLMSTKNPKNFDERMVKRQEEEMVEDIWQAVDCHAHIDNGFRQKVNSFREMNFVQARMAVADEIMDTRSYVPEFLNFGATNQYYEGHVPNLRGSNRTVTNQPNYQPNSGNYHSNVEQYRSGDHYQGGVGYQSVGGYQSGGGYRSNVEAYQSGDQYRRGDNYEHQPGSRYNGRVHSNDSRGDY